jgi:hypothetical protein
LPVKPREIGNFPLLRGFPERVAEKDASGQNRERRACFLSAPDVGLLPPSDAASRLETRYNAEGEKKRTAQISKLYEQISRI